MISAIGENSKYHPAMDLIASRFGLHESPTTDVILVGHSMGGLLATEVALLPPYTFPETTHEYRHRILGILSVDCPFLGLQQPGVFISGLSCLFRSPSDPFSSTGGQFEPGLVPILIGRDIVPAVASVTSYSDLIHAPPPKARDFADQSHLRPSDSTDFGSIRSVRSVPEPDWSDTSSWDPNYNPPFPNDRKRQRRGTWDNAMYYVTKHSGGLITAMRSYVTSHLKFGKSVLDHKELKDRYSRIRALENVNTQPPNHSMRIRFVNYYTACTGRPKRSRLPTPRSSCAQFSPIIEEPISPGSEKISLSEQNPRSPIAGSKDTEEARNKTPRTHETPPLAAGKEPLPGETPGSNTDAEIGHLDTLVETNEEQEGIAKETGDSGASLGTYILASPSSTVPERSSNTRPKDTDTRLTEDSRTKHLVPSTATVSTPVDSGLPEDMRISPLQLPSPGIPLQRWPHHTEPPRGQQYNAYQQIPHKKSSPMEKIKALIRAIKYHRKAIKHGDRLEEELEKAAMKAAEKKAIAIERQRLKVLRRAEKEAVRMARMEAKRKDEQKGQVHKKTSWYGRWSPFSPPDDAAPANPNDRLIGRDSDSTTCSSSIMTARSQTSSSTRSGSSSGGSRGKPLELRPLSRIRFFCRLPPKIGNRIDPCWIPILMREMDEIGAHSKVFVIGDHYAPLVCQVGERIKGWVEEDVRVRKVGIHGER